MLFEYSSKYRDIAHYSLFHIAGFHIITPKRDVVFSLRRYVAPLPIQLPPLLYLSP